MTVKAEATLDVRQLIDDLPLSAFQRTLVFVGFLIVVFDGFDVVVMGYVALQLRTDWGISHQALGGVFSAGLVGQALGAMIAGPLADRYGRKGAVALSVLWFGIWTLATASADDVGTMLVFRFLTGLGLGAAMPNASTLVAEYAPARSRSLMVTITLSGFTVGAAGGGFISAWMIPAFGWRSMLVLGGLMPFAAAAFFTFKMPESVSFLIARDGSRARIRAIVERLAPGISDEHTAFIWGVAEVPGSSAIRIVLSAGYRFGTAMLWLGYFCVLFLVYLLSSWLPTIIRENGGYTLSEAAVAAGMFQIGGPIGSVCIGWLMDRRSKGLVLAAVFLCGAFGTYGLGQVRADFIMLCFVAGIVGFCMNGGSVGMNALAAAFYPTAARATGTCWMIGIGRVGATVSAIAGGALLAAGWSSAQVLTILVIPALVASVAMLSHRSKELRLLQDGPEPVQVSEKAKVGTLRNFGSMGKSREINRVP